MKEIIILDQLINENNNRIKLFRKHLADNENGDISLTKVIKASTESSLENATEKVRKYKEMQDQILNFDKFSDKDKARIVESLYKKKILENYTEKTKEEKEQEKQGDKKLEIMYIIDELSSDLEIEDEELFEIAAAALHLDDEEREKLEEKLYSISDNFKTLIKNIDKDFVKKISSFNYRIPILILHFYILTESIKASYEKINRHFGGFPKYEDWWIKELWTSHQAYYGIFKLKEIIKIQCISVEQKESWERIFGNWLSIKQYLGSKGKLAYPYLLAFDNLISKFTGFEEELVEENLISMDKLINNKIYKEDFSQVTADHNLITSYMRFKKKAVLKEKLSQEEE